MVSTLALQTRYQIVVGFVVVVDVVFAVVVVVFVVNVDVNVDVVVVVIVSGFKAGVRRELLLALLGRHPTNNDTQITSSAGRSWRQRSRGTGHTILGNNL